MSRLRHRLPAHHLAISPLISPHLPISRGTCPASTSPYLPISPHISPYLPAPARPAPRQTARPAETASTRTAAPSPTPRRPRATRWPAPIHSSGCEETLFTPHRAPLIGQRRAKGWQDDGVQQRAECLLRGAGSDAAGSCVDMCMCMCMCESAHMRAGGRCCAECSEQRVSTGGGAKTGKKTAECGRTQPTVRLVSSAGWSVRTRLPASRARETGRCAEIRGGTGRYGEIFRFYAPAPPPHSARSQQRRRGADRSGSYVLNTPASGREDGIVQRIQSSRVKTTERNTAEYS